MHPAFSVIFLTTLIGVGQGLFLALFTVESYAAFGLLPAQDGRFQAPGSAVALGFLAAGLIASFFHLGRPERAWRSAAQWRTSWLSREVIVLPAFMGAVFLYGAAHFAGFNPVLATLPSAVPVRLTLLLGIGGTLLAFALFVCTGMIYACLRFLAEWHTALTPINYILMGGASGFVLATAMAALAVPTLVGFLGGWALILTALAAVGRIASLWRNARLKPRSTPQTAIGIKHPRIVQRSAGFMAGSFNTREFFHGKPMAWLKWTRHLAIGLGFVVPFVLLAAGRGEASAALLMAAFAIQYLGLLAERWLFFAQARHPQNLYYQAVA